MKKTSGSRNGRSRQAAPQATVGREHTARPRCGGATCSWFIVMRSPTQETFAIAKLTRPHSCAIRNRARDWTCVTTGSRQSMIHSCRCPHIQCHRLRHAQTPRHRPAHCSSRPRIFVVTEQSAMPAVRSCDTQRRNTRCRQRVSDHAVTKPPARGHYYTAVTTHVAFADGQGGRRLVADSGRERRRRRARSEVRLLLDDARGCATWAHRTEACFSFGDNDQPPVTIPIYTLYVTVTGLAGTGLVVEDSITGANIATTIDGTQALGYPYQLGLRITTCVCKRSPATRTSPAPSTMPVA